MTQWHWWNPQYINTKAVEQSLQSFRKTVEPAPSKTTEIDDTVVNFSQTVSLQTSTSVSPVSFALIEDDAFSETSSKYIIEDTLNIVKNTDGSYSFTPSGHATISNITMKIAQLGNVPIIQTESGGILVYNDETNAIPIPETNYTQPIYIAKGASLTLSNNTNTLSDIYIYNTASLSATNGNIGNLYVDDGATAYIADQATLTGTLTLKKGGITNIITSTGGAITIEGADNTGIIISGKSNTTETTVISSTDNFDKNNNITLEDVQRSDIAGVTFGDADHITITLKDASSITLNIPNIESTGYTLGENDNGNIIFETSFLTGTAITTPTSNMNVEHIKIGDIIKTFNWKTNKKNKARVIWVCKKQMVVKTHLPDDLAGYPVRILKDAISTNVPNQDLLLTPGHCIFFDKKFIPVRMLVNGRSIYYDRSITSYDYYNIKTKKHSIIWANNTLTETYLDADNKNTFKNNHNVVLLFNQENNLNPNGSASLNLQHNMIEPIYNQLSKRAISRRIKLKVKELSLTNDSEFCLMTKCGMVIQAHSINNGKYIFSIPEDIHTVQLRSRTYRPNETIGAFIDDRRELGILVGSILIINSKEIHEITDHLSNQDLKGWDVIEQSHCRWTNGQATLNIHQNHSQKRILIVNILAAGPYINKNHREVVVEKIAS
ncbi:Hint domain-containing protein [Commensalibacter intestini]|uniref:Hint domain-containing protein n=1 Tax=Commensalibacter intestini TaxID=479936 RepID=UPI000A393B4E|nr:Hint domain-containing protein [Commensalibacter intestini]